MPAPLVILCWLLLETAGDYPGWSPRRAAGLARPNPGHVGPARRLATRRAADLIAARNVLLKRRPEEMQGTGVVELHATLANFRIVSREERPDGLVRTVIEIGRSGAATGEAETEAQPVSATPIRHRRTRLEEKRYAGDAAANYLNDARALERAIRFYKARLDELERLERSVTANVPRGRLIAGKMRTAFRSAECSYDAAWPEEARLRQYHRGHPCWDRRPK